MIFDILTLFPEMFDSYLKTSILGKAIERGRIEVRCHNIRDFARDKHRMADDTPYGGGSGMVMKPEPIVRCVERVRGDDPLAHVVLLGPQGRPFRQAVARELAARPRLVLVCGRYEGVDDRVRDLVVDEEVSIGDYVLSGGELAAMILVDATARLLPGFLGDEHSAEEESFSDGLLEYPQYTRPRMFRGREVPDILLSGDHGRIAAWRRRKALERTYRRRPDLLDEATLSSEERAFLADLGGKARDPDPA